LVLVVEVILLDQIQFLAQSLRLVVVVVEDMMELMQMQ
jgi:hypothetical protein